ncbi:MAG: HAD family hydrolase [Nanobdellota archaeon]
MRYNRLLFDVSGTLWDDVEQVFLANYEVLKDEGYKNMPGTQTPISVEGLKAKAMGSCVEMFRYFGMKGPDEELNQRYIHALDKVAYQYPVKLYQGVKEMLQSIDNDIDKVVISAHPQHRLEEDLEKVGIYDQFKRIIGNCHKKAETIHNNLKSNPTPYIGDTKSDIRYAKKARALPFAVTYGYGFLEELLKEKPHKLFSSPYALKEHLVKKV